MTQFAQINDALLGSTFDGLTAAMNVLAVRSEQRREQKLAAVMYEGLQAADTTIEQLLAKDKDAVRRFNNLLNNFNQLQAKFKELERENEEKQSLINRASDYVNHLVEARRIDAENARRTNIALTRANLELKSSDIRAEAWTRIARVSYGLPERVTPNGSGVDEQEEELRKIFKDRFNAVWDESKQPPKAR